MCVGVCFSVVPVLPRPVLFRVLTMGKFARAVGLLSSLPASHHQTGVFTSACQRRCCAPCVHWSVYTFASMILVFATSRGVVTNAAVAPTRDTWIHLAKCKHDRNLSLLSVESLNIKNKPIYGPTRRVVSQSPE